MTDKTLIERLRTSTGFRTFTAGDGYPAICADTDLMREAANRIEALEQAMSMIAHCDTPNHHDFEPHGLYRSMMISIAQHALKEGQQ